MAKVRTAVVLALFALAHLTVLADLRVADIRPDALLALAVAGGLAGGPERGAALGFVAGALGDLFVLTPFGLSALVLTMVGFAVGLLQAGIIRSAWWIPVATAFVAGVGGTVLWALAGAVLGVPHIVNLRLLGIALVVGTFAALLCPLALRLLAWAWRDADRPAFA
jgi:rod shape-determining protein MreD